MTRAALARDESFLKKPGPMHRKISTQGIHRALIRSADVVRCGLRLVMCPYDFRMVAAPARAPVDRELPRPQPAMRPPGCRLPASCPRPGGTANAPLEV